jgi:hypothetical protein
MAQTHPPHEIVVVDDGSTDGTAHVCTAHSLPVRYVWQNNAGVGAARNRGIREAAGEWIAFLDSDDVWLPRKLEVQLAAVRAYPHARWSVTGAEVMNEAGRTVPAPQGFERIFPVFTELGVRPNAFFARFLDRGEIAVQAEPHTVYSGDVFELLFHGNVGLPSSALVHREMLERCGGFDDTFRLAEETEFFHRLAAAAEAAIVMTPLVRYRVGTTGALTAPHQTARLVDNALRSLDRASALRPLSPGERSAYHAGRRRLLLRLAYAQLSMLARGAARDAAARAWRAGPGPRPAAIYAASLLPKFVLRTLHVVKRFARRLGASS